MYDVLGGKPFDPYDWEGIADLCTNGKTPKSWEWNAENPKLWKGSTLPYHQEAYSEVIASVILDQLGIDHVHYWEAITGHGIRAGCRSFTNAEKEFIPARDLYNKIYRDRFKMEEFIARCKELGIEGVQEFMDRMLVADYILDNEDRHWGNFGFLRNPDTLEWIGAAPLFDHGSALGAHLPVNDISQKKLKSSTFDMSLKRQLELVESFDWLDITKLDGLGDLSISVFRRCWAGMSTWMERVLQLDPLRIFAIAESLDNRARKLKRYIENKAIIGKAENGNEKTNGEHNDRIG